jgi:hypothetical protein
MFAKKISPFFAEDGLVNVLDRIPFFTFFSLAENQLLFPLSFN